MMLMKINTIPMEIFVCRCLVWIKMEIVVECVCSIIVILMRCNYT